MRFQKAFPAALQLAQKEGARVCILGDVFDLHGALVTPLSLAKEASFLVKHVTEHVRKTRQPIEMMAGNHDSELAEYLPAILPEKTYELLPPVSLSTQGELLTHGHLIELPMVLRVVRKALSCKTEDDTPPEECIALILQTIFQSTKVQRELQRRERRYRKTDSFIKLLHQVSPKRSLQRMRIADQLVQEKYIPKRARLHDRILLKRQSKFVEKYLQDTIYAPLSGADLLMGIAEKSWTFIRGHDHVPTLQVRTRRDVEGHLLSGKYLHGNCGSFLSRTHPATCIFSEPKERSLTLLRFQESEGKWEKLQKAKLLEKSPALAERRVYA